MNYYFVDDQGAKLGGAEMTFQAIIDYGLSIGKSIQKVATRDLGSLIVDSPAFYVLGNVCDTHAPDVAEPLKRILEAPGTFSKIEFDYGYIPYRGTIPYEKFTGGKYAPHPANPLEYGYKVLRANAHSIFYMSKVQRKIHEGHLGKAAATEVVLSSCFTEDNLDHMKLIRGFYQEDKADKWTIVDGRDPWQQWCKGVTHAQHAIENTKLSDFKDYEVVKTDSHEALLQILGKNKGYIMLPNIHDTCPRTVIEARLCGAEVITNNNVQHCNESWYDNKTPVEIEEYIRERPAVFWENIPCDSI